MPSLWHQRLPSLHLAPSETLTASHLHCRAGSSRSFAAIRKDAGLCCGSRLRNGEVFAYVGSIQNLKDLKASRRFQRALTDTGISSPNNQRQHRTSHAPKDVLPLGADT